MKNECSIKPQYSIWANALLSDGKILFWYTDRDKAKSKFDFYKDFYYSRIKVDEYEKTHKLTLVRKEFFVFNDEDNNKIFDVEAVEFYKQYEISPDYKGQPPYRKDVR